MFARTIDGGMTWEDPKLIYDPPNGQTVANQIVVLPNGDVLDFFSKIESTDGETPEDIISLAYKRSTDQGTTWMPFEPPITVSSMEPTFNLVNPDNGVPIRGAGELFDVAVDLKRGTLFAVWQDGRFDNGSHDSIAFTTSKDGGRTWSPPIKINQTPRHIPVQDQQAFVPSVSVNANGIIAITYYDFRLNDEGPEALTDMWAITRRPRKGYSCLDARDWREIRLTDESFDLGTAPLADGYFLGDYEGLARAGKNFSAVFSVSSTTDPANVVLVLFNNNGWPYKKMKGTYFGRRAYPGNFHGRDRNAVRASVGR